jgi:hypothetical protein
VIGTIRPSAFHDERNRCRCLFDRERGRRRTSASVLSISDVAETIADALKNQRREILEHVNRMFQHAAIKSSTAQ